MQLQLSTELEAGLDATRRGEPLPLKLAYALISDKQEEPRAVDLALAEPALYDLRVNEQPRGVTRLVRLPDGRWLARRADLDAWRIRAPDAKPVLYRGEEYFPLDHYENVRYAFDTAAQTLALAFPARYFLPTELQGAHTQAVAPTPPRLGGFLNYDLFGSASDEARQASGLFESGVFSRYGVGLASLLGTVADGNKRFIRLDSTWTRDFPDKMTTLTLGDAIGSSGIWGRPVRFGGIRYGTNFATNPGFVTFPLPALGGEAALPTTTELYIDGVLRQSSTVPPGPFRLTNLPAITGQGEVRLVVRDLLGREQVISVPYYTSSQLLRKGLNEDSYELGFVRENFGIRSSDYGRAVLALQRRRGFTDTFTAEARAEVLRDQQTIGGGGSLAFPKFGVATAAAAVSRSDRGTGELFSAGFERQVVRGVSFGARSQWTTSRFRQLGLQPDQPAPTRVMSANAGWAPPGYGSFGFAYIRQDDRNAPSSDIASASYSITLGKASALVVTALKPVRGEGSTAVAITFSMAFDERISAFATHTAQGNATESLLQVQKALPTGSGTGYRLLAGTGEQGARSEVGVAWQTATGTYIAEAGHAQDSTSYRASASGAVALIDGRTFLSRQLTDSFAVAQVPGYSNVGVYVNNQLVARTDTGGYALLPRLLPYQANPVRIELADLPLDTDVRAAEVHAIPYFRSGLFLQFPVQRASGALVTLRLAGGDPMPVGSTVRIVGGSEEFPVAERGEAYVTGLTGKDRIRATWRDQSCELDLDIRNIAGPVPRVGPLTCAGVTR